MNRCVFSLMLCILLSFLLIIKYPFLVLIFLLYILYTPELINLVHLKNYAYAKYKSSPSLVDYCSFPLLRARFKFMFKECYHAYISCISLSSYPHSFWSVIHKTRLTSSISANLVYCDSSSTNPVDATNFFSNFLLSIYTTSLSLVSLYLLTTKSLNLVFLLLIFTLDGVSNEMCSFRNIKVTSYLC